ncbi:MAG: histidine kinase [Pseudomonadota bacterium]
MKRSLLLRFGLTLAAIFVLAVISMLSSVFIADTAEGYAAAINQAGTLRMQSYRIASSLVHDTDNDLQALGIHTERLVNEFNDRLVSPRIHNVLSKGPCRSVLESYAIVEDRWLEKIHPLLASYLELSLSGSEALDRTQVLAKNKQDYLTSVDCFVDDIHAFVEALEIDAEQKNHLLRIIQIISLIFIFIVASVSIYLAKISVLKPLRELQVCANSARQGDFSVRSRYLNEDELGQLGQAFNVMAEDLSKIYEDLEQRVKEKTLNLERSNRSLELLYNTTKTLSDSSLSDEVLEQVIRDIQQLMSLEGGTICLGQSGEKDSFRLVTSNPYYIQNLNIAVDQCESCIDAGKSQICQLKAPGSGVVQAFSTPIKDQSQQYGVLMVELGDRAEMAEWQQRLLETVASHIALSINMAQQVSQTRLVSLLEERSAIARELHDSLAQSLSYLKIQVSRLEKSVTESADRKQILAISKVLRSALNGAYRQLRDLLTTFRLRINATDFCITLQETVEEFSKRGDITITYKNRATNCRFSPNAEIHLIQIIREALSNVIRHANATHAMLSIECDKNGLVTLLVEDDGGGFGEQHDMMQHYGLPIMKERAEWLGGELQIDDSGG